MSTSPEERFADQIAGKLLEKLEEEIKEHSKEIADRANTQVLEATESFVALGKKIGEQNHENVELTKRFGETVSSISTAFGGVMTTVGALSDRIVNIESRLSGMEAHARRESRKTGNV